jgi:ATP-dependent helicase/nuclease subunit B
MRTPRVFTISATTPFLPTLAQALLDGVLIPGFAPRNDPLLLASATVYLPTRRATRAFGDALLSALGAEATLLPRIIPLGEVDEDALAFADVAGLPERPSPLSTAARRLALARLIREYAVLKERLGEPSIATTLSAALQLADELARLFDDMTIAGLPFDALDEPDLIPTALDKHWQDSLVFLKYVRPAWDEYLAANGLADPVAWRDVLLGREVERLAADGGPVVAAGSTGTIPAVAELIAVIARRSNGAAVLPGLDQTLDDESFSLLGGGKRGELEVEPSPGHPQFGMRRLLARIGIERGDVTRLGGTPSERETLLSEVFRPAATSERWRERDADFGRRAARALEGFAVMEAADPREEALALALALRETLNTPGASAALVTPDRALARRVAAELRRWAIDVDDSGGVALSDSDAARLARLALSVAADGFAPVPLIALLRNPLAQFGLSVRAVDAIEIAALRGPRPAPGAAGLDRAVADARRLASAKKLHHRDPRMKLSGRDWDLAATLAERVAAALAPLLQLPQTHPIPFAELIAAHRAVLVNMRVDFAKREPADLRALAQALDRFVDAAAQAPSLTLRDYADAFANLLAGEPPVRPPFNAAARIRILGPLEARLLDDRRVLLGGLNERTWPSETRSDAWLNRPMRKALGLDLPERRIGLAAHDFAQAVGAREVIVSRARKENGVEMVASRFLQRFEAVAPADAWEAACTRGQRYIELAHALERVVPVPPAERPAPRPPAEARPARLSVTEIETLIRDPYSIYARHVLRLDPLEEIDADAGAAERGTILHEAFAEFARATPDGLSNDALEKLIAAGRKAFAAIDDYPELRAVWWPRFVRAARWFIGHEIEHRKETKHIIAETSGKISFEAGGRPFTLSARADRIDVRKDGAVAIADYKSGQPPSPSQILSGLAPQLPLEAAIVRDGGFDGIPKGTAVAEIAVIRVSGGQPPGEWCVLDVTRARGPAAERAKQLGIDTPDRLAAASRELLEALIRKFAEATAPYLSIPRPKWRGRFGQYDHLARIKEWSANEEGLE